MLLSFSFSNWKSFRDETSFSMVAGREERFTQRLPIVGKYKLKALPTAAIYGANASGKSAFISALRFARQFIIQGSEPDAQIDLKPYLLDKEYLDKPSSFAFTFLIGEDIYRYSFSLSTDKVISESLVLILKTTESKVFSREAGKDRAKVQINSRRVMPEERTTLKMIGDRTIRNNQLFLTSTIYQACNTFKPIYDWLKYKLQIIGPDSIYVPVCNLANEQNKNKYSSLLNALDTGIVELGLTEANLSESRKRHLQDLYKDQLKEGRGILLSEYGNKDRIAIQVSKDKVEANMLISKHWDSLENPVDFTFGMESDGTNRLLDILPAFVQLIEDSGMVFVIDELDRSLHTLVSKALIKYFLDTCSKNSRNQLIFSTHDVMLMDQALLRRDELWITDRSLEGASSLYSFSDYKDIRADKDIRKAYLQGNLMGVPNILMDELCSQED
ncbi:MAG: ATP-binding protein [Candidatus Cloacimonadaceae bacterium]|jgi:AAA15 family ATPase/GTPase|nr:ATP-binding protein [Candidatus Cloacimonadota bacterium]MCB5255142.1 ATP-binding protein [Candidatus Cloacimonadota bacterium]MCK9178741.1 ATP-binding protein [Candidatus Cloacimonadota bacterium]MCK9241701.1 ATP-binding protein [Candidatus Cloacimonadota bacterium]MDY0127199.1 ATP-binding protein [Candidatus Cloacimonadaceae bacterium]